jgi:hypothetical protein
VVHISIITLSKSKKHISCYKKEEDQLVQKTSPGQSPGISLLLNMQRVENAQTVVRLDITKGHVRSIIKI